MNESTLRNCRILIRNTEDGEIIADTEIIRYNRAINAVFISADSLAEKKPYSISAWIFTEGRLYEFTGTIRGGVVNNEIEVLLGKKREKEDRAMTRYPMETEGSINGMIIDGKLVPLHPYTTIHTVNMSATGVLIRADAGRFKIGDGFSLILGTEEKGMVVRCEVVRIQSSSEAGEEYGCRIIEIRRNSDAEPDEN